MSDRDTQDELIRALADADFRNSAQWRSKRMADEERVERFARFLARHFYRERVIHFFKYSRRLASVTGRRPERVVDSPAFGEVVPRVSLGSRETAAEVSGLVVDDQLESERADEVPYLRDLLRYQEAMMVVEAGPRDWGEPRASVIRPDDRRDGNERGDGDDGDDDGTDVVEVVEGTRVLELDHDLPAVLPALMEPWTEVPEAPGRPIRLLVARSPHGRVSVAHTNATVTRLLELVDGHRTGRELAADAGLDPAAVPRLLEGLDELGAIRLSTGS